MSTSERDGARRAAVPLAGRDVARGVTMGQLLASCAAARAVSTPPQRPAGARGTARATTNEAGTREEMLNPYGAQAN